MIFWAHACCRKKVWQDWVIIDWAGIGKLPAKLWGFADLSQLAQNASIKYGSCRLCSGVYAIVESATHSEDKAAMNWLPDNDSTAR